MKVVNSKFNSINKKAIKGIVFGALIGILLTIILTMAASLVITLIGRLPDGALEYIALALLAAGGFAGGYLGGRIYRKNGLFIGMSIGTVMFIIVFLAGINSISGGFSVFTLLKLFTILILSSAGAILAVNKKEKLRYK